MAEALVAIPPDIVVAVRPAAIPPSSSLLQRASLSDQISRRVSFSTSFSQRVSLSSCFIAYVAFSCFSGVCRLHVVFFFSACVAFQLGPVSHCCRVSLSLQFHGVFRILLSIQCSQRVSLTSCFYGVCRLQVVFTACVTFQLTFSGVCIFYASFMVSFVFCSPLSFHSVYPLQVVFMACVAFRLAAFLALDACRLAFITCFPLIFYFRCECRFQVSSAFIASYPFQAGFSFRSVCRFQSSFWHLLLLFIHLCRFPLFGPFFHCVLLFCPRVRRVILVLYFTFSILWGPCFFLYACSFAYPVVCRVFIHVRCCLRFLSRNQFQSGKFSSLFLCLFVYVLEVKHISFLSSLIPRSILFSRLLFSWHF